MAFRNFCITEIGHTPATFFYAFHDSFANLFIEISFNFDFAGRDPFESNELPSSMNLASLGEGALPITLTFETLLEGCTGRDALRFLRPTPVL